jgi:hypothetical protein
MSQATPTACSRALWSIDEPPPLAPEFRTIAFAPSASLTAIIPIKLKQNSKVGIKRGLYSTVGYIYDGVPAAGVGNLTS